jgi:glycosyltransferase involved in cell wall biosynthesis
MKLLILSLDSYSIFHPDSGFIFGGAEVETGYHAGGLAALGAEVVVVTRDHGIPAAKKDNVLLVPHPDYKGAGYWKKRRSFAGRIAFRLFGDRNPDKNGLAMYHRLSPDIGYVMGTVPEALQLAEYCKSAGKPFVFRVAHDMDLGDGQLTDERMKKWGGMTAAQARTMIEQANLILVQTPRQQELLKNEFGREGVMMFPPIDTTVPAGLKEEKRFDVLWIGKNNSFKRPEQLVELAQNLPQRRFCMVLNKMDPAGWDAIVKTLPPNITLVESVPVNKIEDLFRQSRVFVSTSLHEGFANTFLQAGKNHVPVVSMGSDPNGMLTAHRGGLLPGDNQDALRDAVECLLTDESLYTGCATAARDFVVRFHGKEQIAAQLFSLLKALC